VTAEDGGSRVAKAPKVLILNGPNLNMLGTRQPEVYGAGTLADIEAACGTHAKDLGLTVTCRQSNSEGELVGWIQTARDDAQAIIINPGAYTHTSVAILDALLAAELPVVEVHLSNIHRREEFRHHSYISKAAQGVICGFGARGYIMALEALAAQLIESQEI
jgi:3-dehydroquinate dehydratase-2